MTQPNFYIYEEQVRSFEIGPDQRLKLRPLLHHLQEAAVGHSNQAGDTFPTQLANGAVWVLSRIHVQMDRYPRWESPFKIETWSVAIEALTAIRDFQIEDDEGLCGRATTQWLLMNIEKRRPVRIPKGLESGYGRKTQRMVEDSFEPLPELEDAEFSLGMQVGRGALDSVNHVNNAFAVEWCLESLPDERIKGLRLVGVEAAFKRELVYGDELRSETATAAVPDIGSNGEVPYLHRLIRADGGAVLIQARSRWTPC